MHPDDLNDYRFSPTGNAKPPLTPLPPSGITLQDWDAMVSLALETLARDCDEMIAALETRMNSPLSQLFDFTDPRA